MTDLSDRGLTRRTLMQGIAAAGAGGGLAAPALARIASAPLAGNIRHSVARWTYDFLPLPELCTLCRDIGITAIDLCGPRDWPVLREQGLDSSMCNGAELGLEDGWADAAHHAALTDRYLQHIDLVADAGYRNLILFSGNRRGMDPEDGMRACESGLKRILGAAERRGVVLHMELLNSRVNHPDYLCDTTAWGVALCERLGSANFKLLYDIYHMPIMEGDVIRRIGEHHAWFGHYHSAGNPGRHEPDDSQELNYPAICRAIRDSGFDGWIAQEFVPSAKTPAAAAEALRAAVRTCDV